MNTQLAKVPEFHDRILQIGGGGGVEHIAQYEDLTQESLRGRAGGAVTLAVGMAHIFDQAVKKVSTSSEEAMRGLWKYWYHFAIMFEALFILTTIDAGTRIGRFLVQEVGGKVLTDPNATVVVRQINSRKVFITGEVHTPNAYQLTAPRTVMQLIAMAGGLTEFAQGDKITILRGGKALKFNYKDVSKGKHPEQNILLQPGDTVSVP